MPNAEQQRVYLGQLASTLWKFQQEDIFCDTTLVTRGSVEVSAHSAVLGAVSSKLRSLLNERQAFLSSDASTNRSTNSSPVYKSFVEAEAMRLLTPPLKSTTQKKYRLLLLDCESAKLDAVLR